MRWQWELVDQWIVENGYRVILKPRESGAHLIDVVLEKDRMNLILNKVLSTCWSSSELTAYLNTMLAAD